MLCRRSGVKFWNLEGIVERSASGCGSMDQSELKEIKDGGTKEGIQVISEELADSQEISHLVAKDDMPGTEDEDLLMDDAGDQKEKTDTLDVLEEMVILESNPDNNASKESAVQKNSSSKTENACKLTSETLQENQNVVSCPTIFTETEQSNSNSPKAAVSLHCKPSSVTIVPTERKSTSQSNKPVDASVVKLTDSLQKKTDSNLQDPPKNADKIITKKPQLVITANSKDVKESSIEAAPVTSNKIAVKKDATKNETSKDGKSAVSSSPVKIDKKGIKVPQISRNLWVSGLSSNTKAAGLKSLFSKHGKVIGAKVVTNARNPGSKCYGFVTMGTPDEATACIDLVNRTEFNGRMISVERAKTEPQGGKTAPKTTPSIAKSSTTTITKSDKNPAVSKKLIAKPPTKEKEAKKPAEKEKVIPNSKKKPEEVTNSERARERPSVSIREKKQRDSLSFAKIKAARERTRLVSKQRFLRNEERRLRFGLQQKHYHQEFIEQRQREEKMKLDREKHKLREMKEQLEREKMETERLKLETERLRILKEQESYRREQQRVLQESRPQKRSIDHGRRDNEWRRKKRATTSEQGIPDRRQQVRSERKPERYERKEQEQVARYDSLREERPGRRDRYEETERSTRTQREYENRDEHRKSYRQDRSLESQSQRERRFPVRDSTRRQAKTGSRSEWKIDREPTRGSQLAWNGPVDYKTQSGWSPSGSSSSRQTGTWQGGAVMMSQSGTSYTVQPGAVMSNMGATPIIIAQPGAMQGTPVILQGNISRHGNGHYNLSSGTVQRY